MELVDSAVTCGPGVKLAGFGAGEASTDLANEIGVQNGDVISKLNGTIISTTARAVSVLEDVAELTEFEVVVLRRNGTKCDSTTYDLTVE